MIYVMKMPTLAIFDHFWPVFGLVWPPHQYPMLLLSTFDLVVIGLSEISRNFLNVNNIYDENAYFGHFKLFLASFWPVFSNLLFL